MTASTLIQTTATERSYLTEEKTNKGTSSIAKKRGKYMFHIQHVFRGLLAQVPNTPGGEKLVMPGIWLCW